MVTKKVVLDGATSALDAESEEATSWHGPPAGPSKPDRENETRCLDSVFGLRAHISDVLRPTPSPRDVLFHGMQHTREQSHPKACGRKCRESKRESLPLPIPEGWWEGERERQRATERQTQTRRGRDRERERVLKQDEVGQATDLAQFRV